MTKRRNQASYEFYLQNKPREIVDLDDGKDFDKYYLNREIRRILKKLAKKKLIS